MTEQQDIIELQSRVAFQEEAIHSLNDVVARQGEEIQTLQKQLAALYKRIDDLKYDVQQGSDSPEPPPPHY